MIGVFDFDMTTGITQGKETASLSQFTNPEIAVPDILSAKPTSITKNRLTKYNRVFILTARSGGYRGEMRNALKKYFMQNGVYIPNNQIITAGDFGYNMTTAQKKQFILSNITRRYKQVIHFYDDDTNNVEYARSVRLVQSFQV
jgi:hypothetical protein